MAIEIAGENDVGVIGDDVVRESGGEEGAYCIYCVVVVAVIVDINYHGF